MEKLSWKLSWMCSTWKEMSLILWIDWGRDSKPISPKYEPEALRLHLLISLPFIIFAELWNGMAEKRNPIVIVHWWAGIAPSARWLGYRLCDRNIFVRFPTGINILGKWPTWCTNFFSTYLFLFITFYMFRARRAHHQERQIVSIQPLVTVILCWWPRCVQIGRRDKYVSVLRNVRTGSRVRPPS